MRTARADQFRMEMHRLEENVCKCIKDQELFRGIKTLIVGFSGGPDSTALLLILNKIFGKLIAVHCHHGLRGVEADKDEQWCKKFCMDRNIHYQSRFLNVPKNRKNRESIEMSSRRLRLDSWKQILNDYPQGALALGHHLDDKLENFFIRFLRGSNLSGLTALRPSVEIQGMRIIRPFLSLEKKEIASYLKDIHITNYRFDRSNNDNRYVRNAIRNCVIPKLNVLASSKRGMIKSLEFLDNDAMIIEERVREKIQARTNQNLLRNEFLEVDPSLRFRYLKEWLRLNYDFKNPLKGTSVKNILSNLSQESYRNVKIQISKNHILAVKNGGLSLQKTGKKIKFSGRVWYWQKTHEIEIPELNCKISASNHVLREGKIPNIPNCEYFDPPSLGNSLLIRMRKPGDRMVPFGQTQKVRIKKLVSNAKLEAEQKQSLAVICDEQGEIIWIPLVRRAHYGEIETHCQECIQLSFQFMPENSDAKSQGKQYL